MTTLEVAQLLGVDERTVRGYRDRGLLRTIKLGRRTVRYRASDVAELLNAHEVRR